MSGKLWKPTGGKDSRLDGIMNLGVWHDTPVYIHVTSLAGLQGIRGDGKISATPKKARRGESAKNGVYLNPCRQTFSANAAFTLLFFEEDKYRNSATHCLIFSFQEIPGESSFHRDMISSGSWVQEIIYYKDIKFTDIEVIYSGPNPFVPLDKQGHPDPNAAGLPW